MPYIHQSQGTTGQSKPPRAHSKLIGYSLWNFGFMGAHPFYCGRRVSGTIYFFTFGLLLIGWVVDLFLIPGMN